MNPAANLISNILDSYPDPEHAFLQSVPRITDIDAGKQPRILKMISYNLSKAHAVGFSESTPFRGILDDT
jgi:hypothetical protein